MEMMRMRAVPAVVAAVIIMLATAARGQQCGEQAGGAICPDCRCCSKWGWCGSTTEYCGDGCQSQCLGCGGEEEGVGSIVSESMFEQMLQHRDDRSCPARGFYTYDAFVEAAEAFPGFGTTGDKATRKRELAAFMAQTAHQTSGGRASWVPREPYAWGYCFKEETEMDHIHWPSDYCRRSPQWPCARGQKYYGRGPIQLTWNYNYGRAGEALGLDLLSDPGLVSRDPVVSFKVAIWVWMTPIDDEPSCHDIMTDNWVPSEADLDEGRLPGYGATTNIINGQAECGHGPDDRGRDRIGFYKRFCDMLGVSYGDELDDLDCYHQKPFKSSVSSKADA